MSAVPHQQPLDTPTTLWEFLARCRFLPTPPPELAFAGDGDFRAIGAEFLRWFVTPGGLRPQDRVLEIGSGIGRMAIPLTQYLDPEHGRYVGLDPVAAGIDWCVRMVSATYPNFAFHHLDVRSDVYNPAGRINPASLSLPSEAASFDFVFLTSVFTHLGALCLPRYASEIGRVLPVGGRCFATFFLMNETAKHGIENGGSRLAFAPDGGGPEYLADPEHPSAAIAQDEGFVLGAFKAAGLHPCCPIRYGAWSGRPSDTYQDIVVFQKRAS